MLSLRMAMPSMSVAAALSGSHLAAFDPPTGLHRLYIAIDEDPAGQEAVSSAGRSASRPMGVETILPLRSGSGDFNDDLLHLDSTRCGSHLRPQLAPIDVPTLARANTS